MPVFAVDFNDDYATTDASVPSFNGYDISDTVQIGPNSLTINSFQITADTYVYVNGTDGAAFSLIVDINAGGYLIDFSEHTGSLAIWGSNFGDLLRGGAGVDSLFGGAGKDSLYSGAGNDTLKGEAGDDEFRFEGPGSGDDTISDFVHGTDKIWLNNAYGYKPADVLAHITDVAGNAVLDLGNGDSITFTGVVKASLSADDFLVDNIAPTVNILAPSYNATEQTDLSLKGQFAIGDADAGSASITVTLQVVAGILSVTEGGSGAHVSGSGTTTVIITGTLAQIAALLNTDPTSAVLYNANSDTPPSGITFAVEIDDGGNTGTDGAKTDIDSATITITSVNDAPTIAAPPSIAATEDQPTTISGIAFNDKDAGGATVTAAFAIDAGKGKLLATSGSGVTVVGNATELMSLSGSVANINAFITAGRLTFEPATNLSGDVTLGIAISDLGQKGTGGAMVANAGTTLVIAAVNDAPALAVTQTATSLAETADTSSAHKVADITVGDVDGGSNGLSLTGADAGLFTIVGTELFLKAGAALDFETNPKLDVTVVLDDPGTGGTPDDSVSLSVDITDVVETLNGNKKDNVLVGGSASETINGKGGDDTIKGGGGADTIIGGRGADVMTGGAGPDVFVFRPGDLPRVNYLDRWLSPLTGDHDLIKDFKPGVDTIDLSAIDANTHKDGNQKFHFEGKQELGGSRGELIYELYGSKPSARHTIVKGDTNGDGDYDLLIVLKGHHKLDAGDFVL